ncbi:hypothetical protein HYH03_018011 [Edaphochlamys debaryana]|uniref:Protein ENHANCED DISEASE RESISTANCE 2 C-terminal domain-containing protein n=1 Tax=Edaphochlamys debaryana TaxID=47281 RepID=A0A835XG62_9CHLO|nr:hypothetical protein HYH03_018011 [Edaphochlamys debaryana]|eukprot:KAG2483121.1 hypothetical protein HYH03_018011 [Edaphochlamys debaryana]
MSEFGDEPVLEEDDVYKATSSSDFVVFRRLRLYRTKFVTFHNIEESMEDNKQWILTSQCDLKPRTASEIKEPIIKYERPRGQWAITTLVKPKSTGTKNRQVTLYMFTLNWPTRWATKGYTSFSFGFRKAESARHWHARIAECIASLKFEKSASASSPGGASYGRYGGPSAISSGSLPYSHAPTMPTAPVTAPGALPKSASMGPGVEPRGRSVGASPCAAPMSEVLEVSSAPPPHGGPSGRHRRSQTAAEPGAAEDERDSPNEPMGTLTGSGTRPSLAVSSAPEGTFSSPGPSSPGPISPTTHLPSSAARPPLPPGARHHPSASGPSHTHSHSSGAPPSPPPPIRCNANGGMDGGGFSASSSESETEAQVPGSRRRRGSIEVAGGGCRMPRGTVRSDVRHSRQRWVPYKQVNGVAIYHRRQTDGDAEAGVGGEFMVSTVVRGSPRRCLAALTSRCGNTTILGPALRQEVLQRRRAEDDKEVQRILLQAPGLTGVLCAPREVVVEMVCKTDESGPTLVLMFNSCEPPARFVERRAGQALEDQGEVVEASSEGLARSWWGRPVSARVRGGYTMAPLEDHGLDTSPEALVTCIMKVDLGGACGERSWLRLVSEAVGWTNAFLDNMLMAVTLLRDEVEQGRFVVQPLNMVAGSKPKERDVSSAADLPALSARSREGSLATIAAAGGSGGSALTGGASHRARGPAGPHRAPLGLSMSSREAAAGAGAGLASPRAVAHRAAAHDRFSLDHPSLLDDAAFGSASATPKGEAGGAPSLTTPRGGAEASAFRSEGGAAAAAAVVAGGVAAGDGSAHVEAEEEGAEEEEEREYETMDDVLDRMRRLACLDPAVWENLHQPGKDAPFKIRGPTYLKDRKKIPAGFSRFVLASMDVVKSPMGQTQPTEHVARYLPSVREGGAPFSIIVHLVIPGSPLLGIIAVFVADRHPSCMGPPPAHPMEDEHDWEPFDFVLHKYLTGSEHTRNHMLKLIPHIADGSWMIKSSVGTTPVILGKQLRTIYYETPTYLEIDIDISANNVASYVTGLVRGATRSLVIDMGFVLEGTTPWELPEALLGTLRLYNLDIRNAKLLDTSRELPLRPPNLRPPPAPEGPRHVRGSLGGSISLASMTSFGNGGGSVPGNLSRATWGGVGNGTGGMGSTAGTPHGSAHGTGLRMRSSAGPAQDGASVREMLGVADSPHPVSGAPSPARTLERTPSKRA